MSNLETSIQFFFQLFVVLCACRIVGWLARWIGQPQVVGEMIAGVVLGPSLFGLLAPSAQRWVFGYKETTTVIFCVAQVGVASYMFIVGLEFSLAHLRARAAAAASVSLAGMLAPFVLGAALGAWLHGTTALFGPRVTTLQAALYLGAAMSITAFPMLARIIYERGIAGTNMGTLALAAGSIDDAAAWCVLAVTLASFDGNPQIAALAIGGGLAYLLAAMFVLRPAMRPLAALVEREGELRSSALMFILALLMLCAWITDAIQLYAVFGAFVFGAALPRGRLTAELRQKIEPLTTNLLLPLFFVYSGLHTRIDSVNSWQLWGIATLVLLAACAGKLLACAAAARWCGESPRAAFAIGALMNSRGLMELIILNIGRERGLISPELFSVMVIMAIVTTLMATPLFMLAYPKGTQPR